MIALLDSVGILFGFTMEFTTGFCLGSQWDSVWDSVWVHNGIHYGFSVRSDQVQRIGIDLTKLESFDADHDGLIDYIEKLFIGRRLDPNTRTELKNAAAIHSEDPTAIARTVLQILVAAPEFAVQK